MRIKDIKYFPFTLNLKVPFQTSKQFITKREGYIISFTDELENTGYGECSPLPNFNIETKEQAEIDLNKIKTKLLNIDLSEEISAIGFQLSVFNLFPSVQFAIEQALLNLVIKRNKNYFEINNGDSIVEINVNAVIGLNRTESILKAIEDKINEGYNTFKIKVGRQYFDQDYQLIKNIRNQFGNEINLRLDANGIWNPEETYNNLERLFPFNIQYIEEPCCGIKNIIKLAEHSPIAVAADESIHTIMDFKNIIRNGKINFIIIKPMVIGGILSLMDLIKEAEIKNKYVIISSSFESVVGKEALVMLAALTKHNIAHGLDTSDYFESDLCDDIYKLNNGKIHFDYNTYPPELNLNLP